MLCKGFIHSVGHSRIALPWVPKLARLRRRRGDVHSVLRLCKLLSRVGRQPVLRLACLGRREDDLQLLHVHQRRSRRICGCERRVIFGCERRPIHGCGRRPKFECQRRFILGGERRWHELVAGVRRHLLCWRSMRAHSVYCRGTRCRNGRMRRCRNRPISGRLRTIVGSGHRVLATRHGHHCCTYARASVISSAQVTTVVCHIGRRESRSFGVGSRILGSRSARRINTCDAHGRGAIAGSTRGAGERHRVIAARAARGNGFSAGD